MVPVQIIKIAYQTSEKKYMVILEDDNFSRFLSISISSNEAQALALAIKKDASSFFTSYDLICDLITKVDGKLLAVNISKLNDGVFYASLKLSGDNFGTKTIDARPSDAISIALRLNAQIYVTAEVIEEAGVGEDEVISDKQNILPKYSVEDLEIKLKKAVEEEEYEKAARIRDKIKDLESS